MIVALFLERLEQFPHLLPRFLAYRLEGLRFVPWTSVLAAERLHQSDEFFELFSGRHMNHNECDILKIE